MFSHSVHCLFFFFFLVKQVKCLLGGKMVCENRPAQAGSERESSSHASLNHLYGAFLPGFLWPLILLCLALSPYLVYLRVLPCVRTSLSQDRFYRRGLWVGWHHLLWGDAPSLLSYKEPFCTYVPGKVSLTLRIRHMWSLYLLSGQGSASPPSSYCLHLGVSVQRGQAPAAQFQVHLSPASGSQSE